MARQVSKKVKLASYALLVFMIGIVTGWFGSSAKNIQADIPPGATITGGDPGACPSGGPDCCE